MKKWLQDFPGHAASVCVGLLAIGVTTIVVTARLALGLIFPDGYDGWLFLLGTLAGANVAGMGVKRVTDFRYKAAGAPGVEIKGPNDVNINTETEHSDIPAPPASGVQINVQKPAPVTQESVDQANSPNINPPGQGD